VRASLLLITGLLLAACHRAPATATPDAGTPVVDPCATPTAGPTPLRRLTRDEYDATVRDLLHTTRTPGQNFPREEGLGFSTTAAAQSASGLLAQSLADAAELLAQEADLPSLLPCPVADACAAPFITAFGRRAFRRPVTPDEATRLLAFFQAQRQTLDVETSYRQLLTLFLQAPQFLFRVEPRAPTPAPVVGYAMATRLSYFLWGTTPDDALLDAAQAGTLDTRAGVETQARRLLADPRAHDAVRRFHVEWLGVTRLSGMDKADAGDWEHLQRSMVEEVARFGDAVVMDGGTQADLFTARFTFVDEALGQLYGIDGITGDDFRQVPLTTLDRGGVLTLPGVMATWAKSNQSSPVLRGRLVRERFLCQTLPTPPANVVVDLPPPTSGTTRQRYTQHLVDPACKSCHQLLDPVGFGFEHYDALGAYRNAENGLPIDSSGTLVSTRDVDGPFTGALDLGARLGSSTEVRDCLVTQWFRYAAGRAETDADRCALAAAQAALTAAHGDLRELLIALATGDALRTRVEATP
jgi:hypothetical protein